MGLRRGVTRAALVIALTGIAGAALAQPLQLGETPCTRPPVLHCPDQGCDAATVTSGGPFVEQQTGRAYFLDYLCDLRRGDDAYLQNIVSAIIEPRVGRDNIKAFWLAGHSQGGLTSTRIVRSDFFRTKADGFLSLSGGRIGGQAGRAASFGVPPPVSGAAQTGRGAAPPAIPPGALVIPPPPTCDFSHIFATGEHEISALPAASERATVYRCAAAPKRREVVDTKAGYAASSRHGRDSHLRQVPRQARGGRCRAGRQGAYRGARTARDRGVGDAEAAVACAEIGLPMVRADSANDDPHFLDMMADMVLRTIRRDERGWALRLAPPVTAALTTAAPRRPV